MYGELEKLINKLEKNNNEIRVNFNYLWNTYGLYEYDEDYSYYGTLKNFKKHLEYYFDKNYSKDIIKDSTYLLYDEYERNPIRDIEKYDKELINEDNYCLIINYITEEA